jgi:predicted ATP-dependent protease
MASGIRFLGRSGNAREHAAVRDAKDPAAPRARTTLGELIRRAGWEQLSPTDREALLRPYAPLTAQASAPADGESDRRSWVADFVSQHLQTRAVSVIHTWLEDAPSDAHLFVSGPEGTGRTSTVVTLARRAMAQRPAPPEYCYVPDPDALHRPRLLTLPPGTALTFAANLEPALEHITHAWATIWAKVPEDDVQRAIAEQTLDKCLAPAARAAPEAPAATEPYLQQLRSALAARIGTPFPPLLHAIEAPTANTLKPPNGAPVIVALRTSTDVPRALYQANGGILVLAADDLLERSQPTAAWHALRAALRADAEPQHSTGRPTIPLTTRVIIIGFHSQYYTFHRSATDFPRLFRYRASFEGKTEWTPQAEASIAVLAERMAHRHSLPVCNSGGVARIVEEYARRLLNDNRRYIPTDLTLAHDLAVEAGHIAQSRAQSAVAAPIVTNMSITQTTRTDVEAALATRRSQQEAVARITQLNIFNDRRHVPTSGAETGRITGLAVSELSPDEGSFGIPGRISAAVSPGRERLVDIEREAKSADANHITGALTMASYLAWRYGRARPLSLVARLRFEQRHEKSAGDSASAAELFALLSAIAEVPIFCSLAVTGAIGQYGDLQPIGGVNHKIEGFWELCRARRTAGEQPMVPYGVLIPAANADDLMLREEVAESIAREAWFHIWPISSVDEGLPLLTGQPVAKLHALVEKRLQSFYEIAMQSYPGM